MTKSAVWNNLSYKRAVLAEYKEKLKQLNEKESALQAFSAQVNTKTDGFRHNIGSRKTKLSNVEPLKATVKCAKQYQSKMNSMLTGTDYQAIATSIGTLQSTIGTELKTLQNSKLALEEAIHSLGVSITNLQEKYDQMED
ncbi:MAG: hypothetical protein PUH12_03850 [Lachnospiraceae bacterium]|nr:hypothetical protein [Lachnospiraceae bacterium]